MLGARVSEEEEEGERGEGGDKEEADSGEVFAYVRACVRAVCIHVHRDYIFHWTGGVTVHLVAHSVSILLNELCQGSFHIYY